MDYPDNDRKAETLLVLAEATRGMGLEEESRTHLLFLLEKFPTSLAADEARQLLAQ